MARLGVNVDHVATLRQARGGKEPDPVAAAVLAELGGADGIVIHLREDRRHIQDRDLRLLREVVQTKLDLEMAATEEMVRIAMDTKPHLVTFVPERRQELTTEGGLDVAGNRERIKDLITLLHQCGIAVSLFIDPELEQIKAARRVEADCIELHTGRYANATGLKGNRGDVLGTASTATLTVKLARHKLGLYLGAGPDHAGAIRVVDIGIPPDIIGAAKIPVTLLEAADIRSWLPVRPRTAHKGTFGHAGIIAGSAGKTGAAAMAAQAALRIGAGLVTVAAPRSVSDVLEAKLLEAMTYPVPETEARTLSKQALEALLAFAETKTALAIGPGIGRHPDTQALIHNLIVSVGKPTVLDADAINAFTGHKEMIGQAHGPLVLTPHPGEMARLLGVTTADVQRDRLGVASRVAREQNVCVVLKGAGTVVAGPDGRLAVNPTGNPGMATGGTGDVLTGTITGLLAQGVTPWGAACAGVYVPGLAGDLAASETGEMGLIAGGGIRAIPLAIRRILEDNAPVR